MTFDRAPKLVGKAWVGKRLRVVHRKVTPRSAEVRYRWFTGTERIRRARGRRLRLTRAMLGRMISVKVVARAPGHTKAVVRLRASAARPLPH